MAEVPRRPTATCRGCGRQFDEPDDDLCRVPHGLEGCNLCRRCHVTAYGQPQPHAFNDAELIAS